MPLSLTSALNAHLAGDLQTLASLWFMQRVDGVQYYFTDHDQAITFDGQVYQPGVGYDRSAIEDKLEMSVDNMDVRGILDVDNISRDDVRGGLLDGAFVQIRIVNYKNISDGSIIRRTGWLGTVKQNNLGQFDAELRGLTQALSEGLTEEYSPACTVDLGSQRCGIPIASNVERVAEQRYGVGQWINVPLYTNVIFRCMEPGNASADPTNDVFGAFANSAGTIDLGQQILDGQVLWQAFPVLSSSGVIGGGDRKRFNVSITASQLADFPDWFNNGAVLFTSGPNAGVSRGVKVAVESTDSGLDVELHLRMPFNVEIGDTCTMIPGCNKTVMDCGNKFNNVLNFQGFPYIPGENYLKKYPNAK